MKKILNRLPLLGTSVLYSTAPVFFNLAIAALIVRFLNPALWGGMVQVLLWTGIASNIMAWGNKDFLIRTYSLHPNNLISAWQKSFGSRSFVIIPVTIALFLLPLPVSEKSLLTVLLLARFVYLSYDSVIVFRRKFLTTVVLELMGFAMVVTAILTWRPVSLIQLIMLFTAAEVVKSFCAVIYFRKELKPFLFSHFDPTYFSMAFSFFVLYFTGMLSSRIDIICISAIFSKEDIARYQVLMSFIQAIQLSIPILLMPFIKNIYRLRNQTVSKLAERLFLLGLVISAIAILVIRLVMQLVYDFQYAPVIFILGWLLIIPGFYYSALIYRMFRSNKQDTVLFYSFLFIVTSVFLIFSLSAVVPDKFMAVVIAMTISQWMQGLLYFYHGTKWKTTLPARLPE
jgi:hypothetical protein